MTSTSPTEHVEPATILQEAIADRLVDAVVDDATGVAEGDTCVGEPPSARYYLASLAPHDANLSVNAVRMGRATPSSVGFEFETARAANELSVTAAVSCYYRRMPTLAEQLEYLGDRLGTAEVYRLAPVFQRVGVQVGPLEVVVGGDGRAEYVLGVQEFDDEFTRVRQVAIADPRVERRVGDERRERSVPADALADAALFEAWLRETNIGDPVLPSFAARVHLATRRVDGRTRVTASLENLSDDPKVIVQGRGRSAGQERRDDSRDHFLFRVRLEVRAEPGVLRPIRMDLGPDAYRYNGDLAAYASNCGVRPVDDGDGLVGLYSVAAPVHLTHRAFARPHPSLAYRVLEDEDEVMPALRQLAEDLRAYRDDPAWDTSGLEPELARRKRLDRDAFTAEVARFEDGLAWLERDERLLLAFRLTNSTMRRVADRSDRPHEGWRRFQLVFLVSQLSALAWREHPPEAFTPGLWGDPDSGDPTGAATVLWYPTGGGKTEAYLGLVVCCLFYDRARGKTRGTSAWCRFPLRLLTLQQTQRQLEVVATADLVREANADRLRQVGGAPGAPFRVGFYAGGTNTPNSLSEPGLLMRLRDDRERDRYRLVDRCPYCRNRTVTLRPPDPDKLTLEHVCTHRDCGRTLPLYITDREIYRYLPAVVVGTLDKLAGIGLSDRFGALLGDVDWICELHGYGRGGKCQERGLGHPKIAQGPLPAPLYDPSPTLEIVDELHMVDEDLGAFAGHYEGLLASAQQALSARSRPDRRGLRMKVIATSATVRGEDRQCEHLFGLRSVVVPLPGPKLEDSFYWRVDRRAPLRRFVGILPTRTTAEMTVVRILISAHTAIRRLQARQDLPPALAGIPEADLDELIDLYRTSLTYVTSLVDFGKIRRSLDTQVNEHLRQAGLPELTVRSMTGDTKFDEVADTLNDLATPGGAVESVVATSMVSHGVDVDRLNLMVFNGMPRSMAEYIQASSRVGRANLGIVFMIFNAVRERDRSHYRYHGKFHEYLDRMVQPVAINRWSRFALRRTLPGVLMGYVLQVANRAWWDAGNAPHHLHELRRAKASLRDPAAGGLPEMQVQALLDALAKAYLADRDEAQELAADLGERVRRAVDTLKAAGAATGASGGAREYRATAEGLGLEHAPMTSLRDVAEGVPFITLPDRRSS